MHPGAVLGRAKLKGASSRDVPERGEPDGALSLMEVKSESVAAVERVSSSSSCSSWDSKAGIEAALLSGVDTTGCMPACSG